MAIDKCAKCGTDMTCDISKGKETCWCYEKPRILKYDPSYKGCFCPKCLDEEIEKVLSSSIEKSTNMIGMCIGCMKDKSREYFKLFFNDPTALVNFINKEIGTLDDPFYTCKECKKICLELLNEKVNQLNASFFKKENKPTGKK